MKRHLWTYHLRRWFAGLQYIYYGSRPRGVVHGLRATVSPSRQPILEQCSIPNRRWQASMKPSSVGVQRYSALSQSLERSSHADVPLGKGPLQQYEEWVDIKRLKDDEFQRGIVQALQSLHEELKSYVPPKVVHPKLEDSAFHPSRMSMLGALFRRKPETSLGTKLPETVPKGLYLHGDVGSGKTMLMDMFYHTLPPKITSKTRIHFHHFMQDVHKRLHLIKTRLGVEFDAIPFVGAELAEAGSVLCFDEFQCTDVADAMILRRLLECLMSHGVVLVATSNRHPDELYLNGIQRESFLPCIALLKERLQVVSLDCPTDYRRVSRPPANVYFYPLGPEAVAHANRWFSFLGDPKDPPHPTSHKIWGRDIKVPLVSGKAVKFTFTELCGSPLSAADYLELCRRYKAFVVTDVPMMDYKTRDLARRFITFIDAIYESRAKLVLTMAAKQAELFASKEDAASNANEVEDGELDAATRSLVDDLELDMKALKNSSIFTGDEERFAFARSLSRLTEMGSLEWVEREQ